MLFRMSQHRVGLASAPASPALARRFVCGAAGRACIPRRVVEVLELLTSELVTNAVVHGGPPIELELSIDPGAIRVAVRDGSDEPARPRAVGVAEAGGRGLALVDMLARRWRAEPDGCGPGKTVWFELDRVPVA